MRDVDALRRTPPCSRREGAGRRADRLAGRELREAATPARLSCWLWARQLGKSERLADLALWAAFTRPGALVLLVSGGGELGARRLLGTARRLAAASPLLSGA